jgi:predicted YcjX-like family ATPase
MAIDIVSFPIKHGDFPISLLYVYQAGYPGDWLLFLELYYQGYRGLVDKP